MASELLAKGNHDNIGSSRPLAHLGHLFSPNGVFLSSSMGPIELSHVAGPIELSCANLISLQYACTYLIDLMPAVLLRLLRAQAWLKSITRSESGRAVSHSSLLSGAVLSSFSFADPPRAISDDGIKFSCRQPAPAVRIHLDWLSLSSHGPL